MVGGSRDDVGGGTRRRWGWGVAEGVREMRCGDGRIGCGGVSPEKGQMSRWESPEVVLAARETK